MPKIFPEKATDVEDVLYIKLYKNLKLSCLALIYFTGIIWNTTNRTHHIAKRFHLFLVTSACTCTLFLAAKNIVVHTHVWREIAKLSNQTHFLFVIQLTPMILTFIVWLSRNAVTARQFISFLPSNISTCFEEAEQIIYHKHQSFNFNQAKINQKIHYIRQR